jgi:UPF0755 protein
VPDLPDPFELLGLEPEPEPAAGAVGGPVRFSADVVPVVGPAANAQDDPPRGSGSGGSRRRNLVFAALAVMAIMVIGAGIWVRGQLDPGSPGDPIAFTISKGATTSDISRSLEQEGIITNATVFGWYLKISGDGAFQAGEYEGLRRNSSMSSVVSVLEKGPAPPRTVSFLVREGLWVAETRALILESFPTIDPAVLTGVMNATHPALQPSGSTNLEGFLFPAKYEVAQADVGDAQKIIDQMISAFDRVSADEGLPEATARLAGKVGTRTITPYQALIVASLIESEAKIPEDRAKIARVIYNRMARGEMLGIDASVLYALQKRKTSLTNSDLKVDSPYNTRLKNGLPPTPINSPGQDSIHAALNPAEGDWIYYVLTDTDGHHYFTNSAADFQRAVNDAKARGVF